MGRREVHIRLYMYKFAYLASKKGRPFSGVYLFFIFINTCTLIQMEANYDLLSWNYNLEGGFLGCKTTSFVFVFVFYVTYVLWTIFNYRAVDGQILNLPKWG